MRTVMMVVVLGVLLACKREGDHCKLDATRCDGDVVLKCKLPNTKTDWLVPHTSNFWDSDPCPEGLHCVRTGDGYYEIGCAESAKPCDPTSEATVTQATGTITVRTCTHQIGKQAFFETRQFERCDPKTFTPKCPRADLATLCVRADDLEYTPAIVRAALHGATVEAPRLCAMCPKCD